MRIIRGKFMLPVILVTTLTIGAMTARGQFHNVLNWAAFDPGNHGVGKDPDGYAGAVFDGRYIYLGPNYNGTQYHGEVLRYDTQGDFTDTSAWAVYDPGASGVDLYARGFWGAGFDGQYLYFVPGQVESRVTGNSCGMTRPRASLKSHRGLLTMPGATAQVMTPTVIREPSSTGWYMYFVPFSNGSETHGEVLRYDIEKSFTEASAWTAYGTVDVFSDATAPDSSFEVRMIDMSCDNGNPGVYSIPLVVNMSPSGDVVGACSMPLCTPPQGVADFIDISAVVEKFKNVPTAPRKARSDVLNSDVTEPTPDQKVDFVDISYCVDAFRNVASPPIGPPLDDPCAGKKTIGG